MGRRRTRRRAGGAGEVREREGRKGWEGEGMEAAVEEVVETEPGVLEMGAKVEVGAAEMIRRRHCHMNTSGGSPPCSRRHSTLLPSSTGSTGFGHTPGKSCRGHTFRSTVQRGRKCEARVEVVRAMAGAARAVVAALGAAKRQLLVETRHHNCWQFQQMRSMGSGLECIVSRVCQT